jgi:hypothetical protein
MTVRQFCPQFHCPFSRASSACTSLWRSISLHEPFFVFTNQYWYCNHKYVSRCCLQSVAHLFLSTWLHQTENIVQYDCDVSAWLCSVIKFNIMTQFFFNPDAQYNCWGTTLMRMHSRWLATVLWHCNTTQFILTIIEINMILVRISDGKEIT